MSPSCVHVFLLLLSGSLTRNSLCSAEPDGPPEISGVRCGPRRLDACYLLDSLRAAVDVNTDDRIKWNEHFQFVQSFHGSWEDEVTKVVQRLLQGSSTPADPELTASIARLQSAALKTADVISRIAPSGMTDDIKEELSFELNTSGDLEHEINRPTPFENITIESLNSNALVEMSSKLDHLQSNMKILNETIGDAMSNIKILQKIVCSVPPDPINGRVRYSSLKYGTVLKYQCDEGYILKEHQPRICSEDGTWSNDEPKCEGDCPLQISQEIRSVPEDDWRRWFKQFICDNYDYAWSGNFYGSTRQENGFWSMVFRIDEVVKEGIEKRVFLWDTNRKLLLTDNCQPDSFLDGSRSYLVFGKDGQPYEGENGEARFRYLLDHKSAVFGWGMSYVYPDGPEIRSVMHDVWRDLKDNGCDG